MKPVIRPPHFWSSILIDGESLNFKELAMSHVGRGLMAGLAATIVLSALMVAKTMMGVMPALDLPRMIAGMMGSPDAPMLGWGVHVMIGVVGYGLAMAWLSGRLPGSNPTAQGVIIGFGGWLIMMIVLMPMVGAGLFGMALGVTAPMMTLVLHLIFGAVLGWTYDKLGSNETPSMSAR